MRHRVVVSVGDIKREHCRSGILERRTGFCVALVEPRSETIQRRHHLTEAVANEHDRLRSRQRLQRVSEKLQRTLDGIGLTPEILAEPSNQRQTAPRFDRRGLLEQELVGEYCPDTVDVRAKALFMTVWCPDSRSVESNCGIPRG